MKKQLELVKKFHKVFKHPIAKSPININPERYLLRHNLMEEENDEYYQAAMEGNVVEVADALGDMLYILCGTILEHGMQYKIEEVFEEIQSSNMSKLGDDGKPIFRNDGKILKGNNYFKPNLRKILKGSK